MTAEATEPRSVGVIVIGRNEGARLIACLDSLVQQGVSIVYVDSGSTDDSLNAARARGATTVELDTSIPFTAARARNAGVEALRDPSLPDYLQFVDGDCRVEPGWIEKAAAALDADPTLGIVTGWRTEVAPEASIYNDICEVEWHRPAGPIDRCGGDMMVRSEAFDAAGGFNPAVIAAEDDEFCIRVRDSGWKMLRLPEVMSRHDAAMTRFSQWWNRAKRAGHGFAQVDHMHPGYFGRELKRVQLYGFAVPAFALISLVVFPPLILLAVAAYGFSYVRSVQGLIARDGLTPARAARHGVFLTLSKLPNVLGVFTFHWRRMRGHAMHLIEYK